MAARLGVKVVLLALMAAAVMAAGNASNTTEEPEETPDQLESRLKRELVEKDDASTTPGGATSLPTPSLESGYIIRSDNSTHRPVLSLVVIKYRFK